MAPHRGGSAAQASNNFSLASSVLGGFGAFLSWHYRIHDYLLGRRNCQQFLRRHFVLDADHPMFQHHWNPALTELTDPKDPDKGGHGVMSGTPKRLHLPVIPLIKGTDVNIKVPVPTWPSGRYDPAALAELTEDRFKALWFATLDNLEVGWLAQTYLGPLRRQAQKRLKKAIIEKLTEELQQRRL